MQQKVCKLCGIDCSLPEVEPWLKRPRYRYVQVCVGLHVWKRTRITHHRPNLVRTPELSLLKQPIKSKSDSQALLPTWKTSPGPPLHLKRPLARDFVPEGENCQCVLPFWISNRPLKGKATANVNTSATTPQRRGSPGQPLQKRPFAREFVPTGENDVPSLSSTSKKGKPKHDVETVSPISQNRLFPCQHLAKNSAPTRGNCVLAPLNPFPIKKSAINVNTSGLTTQRRATPGQSLHKRPSTGDTMPTTEQCSLEKGQSMGGHGCHRIHGEVETENSDLEDSKGVHTHPGGTRCTCSRETRILQSSYHSIQFGVELYPSYRLHSFAHLLEARPHSAPTVTPTQQPWRFCSRVRLLTDDQGNIIQILQDRKPSRVSKVFLFLFVNRYSFCSFLLLN